MIRELDRKVAVKLGLRLNDKNEYLESTKYYGEAWIPIPAYTEYISAAWMILSFLEKKGWGWSLSSERGSVGCYLYKNHAEMADVYAQGENAAEAIVKAFLDEEVRPSHSGIE